VNFWCKVYIVNIETGPAPFRIAPPPTGTILNTPLRLPCAVDLIGMARPLCVDPEAPAALLAGRPVDLAQPSLSLAPGLLGPTSSIKRVRLLNGLTSASWYNEQVIRLAAGMRPDRRLSLLTATVRSQMRSRRMAKALKKQEPPGAQERT
jgi:hypothetical protein